MRIKNHYRTFPSGEEELQINSTVPENTVLKVTGLNRVTKAKQIKLLLAQEGILILRSLFTQFL